MRCRYHALLQIICFFAVVAFHAQAMESGWVAVELFFALAGYNMARAVEQGGSFRQYVKARYRRLFVPVLLLTPVVLLLVLRGSSSALTFALSAPFSAHNLLRVTMDGAWRPFDIAWLPTWFIAALYQLQLLIFLSRRVLMSASVALVLGVTAILGITFRAGVAQLLVGADGVLAQGAADAVYWAPLTHIEATVGGLELGRGRLFPGIARLLVGVAVLVVLLVVIGSSGELDFPLGHGSEGEHVLGYLGLAALAVVLIDKRQPIARFILGLKLSERFDAKLESLSRLTFLGYVLHGGILALVLKYLGSPSGEGFANSSLGSVAVTLFVAGLSLFLASQLQGLMSALRAWKRSRSNVGSA